jgi:hypothetical protein
MILGNQVLIKKQRNLIFYSDKLSRKLTQFD